jgi:hypothetical protein
LALHPNYAWIVERDYTVDVGNHEPRYNESAKRFEHSIPKTFKEVDDLEGPRNAHPKALKDLHAGKGKAFQLWDDDGILYYTGRWFESLSDQGYDSIDPDVWGSDPLHDWGTPAAGATEMTVGNRQAYI